MVHLKGVFSFLCAILTLGQSIDFGIPPSSPCPDVFEYFYENGRLYGVVAMANEANHSQVDVNVTFSVDEVIETDDMGYMNLLDDKVTVIEKVKNGSSILFLVHLPKLNGPPKLIEIRFDDVVVCTGSRVHKRQLPGRDYSRMSFNYRSSDIDEDPEINSFLPEESGNDRTRTRSYRSPDGKTVKKEWSSSSASPDGSSSSKSWGYSTSMIKTIGTDGDIEENDLLKKFNINFDDSFFKSDISDHKLDDITFPTNLEDKFRSLVSDSKLGSNRNQSPQQQYPLQQSTSPQQQSPYQPTQFQYTQSQSQYQPQHPQYPVPNSQYAPQQWQYPVPNSQYPPQQSQYQPQQSQYQPQQPQYPQPQSQYPQYQQPPPPYTQQYTPILYQQSPQQGFAQQNYQQPQATSTPRPPEPLSQTSVTPTASRNGESSSQDVMCGVSAPRLLFSHGSEYKKGDWPWLVAVYIIVSPSTLKIHCSGTLISKRHVVTAAHCTMRKDNTRRAAADLLLKVGVYDLQDWEDQDVQQVGVKKIVRHPRHDKNVNDVAVLVMMKDVNLNGYVTPACLWNGTFDLSDIVGKSGTVVGWGYNEEEKPSTATKPFGGIVPVVSTETCRASATKLQNLVSDTTLCAGSRNGSGPCNEDSGGGLYINFNYQWQLRGIVSIVQPGDKKNKQPCDLNEYVVYTDAAKYTTWIQEVIALN